MKPWFNSDNLKLEGRMSNRRHVMHERGQLVTVVKFARSLKATISR